MKKLFVNFRRTFAVTSLAIMIIPAAALAAGYTGPQTILKYSSISGSGMFEIYGHFPNPDNCGEAGTIPEKYIVGAYASDTDLARESKYSAVLSAYHSGKTIELYVDGCMGSAPIVKNIYTPSR